MKLAVDNDFFCKTEVICVAGLIREHIGVTVSESYVLASLAPQLRNTKSKLYRAYLNDAGTLASTAEGHPTIPESVLAWEERLAHVNAIDPGEVRLIAYTASSEDAVLLATHDKRCLSSVPSVDGLVKALEGKVLMLEEVLLDLCHKHGHGKMLDIIAPNLHRCNDSMLKTCFGSGREVAIREGLEHYITDMRSRTNGDIFCPRSH